MKYFKMYWEKAKYDKHGKILGVPTGYTYLAWHPNYPHPQMLVAAIDNGTQVWRSISGRSVPPDENPTHIVWNRNIPRPNGIFEEQDDSPKRIDLEKQICDMKSELLSLRATLLETQNIEERSRLET